MTKHAVDPSLGKAAKIAGSLFLLIVTGWTLNWIFVDSRLHGSGSAMDAAGAVMAHEQLFRIGLANELIFSISGMVLAWALYGILKKIDKDIALLALIWKLMDSAIGTVSVLASFIMLQVLNGRGVLTASKPGPLQEIAGLFFKLRSNGAAIAMLFLGLAFIVFFYLLFKSKYVPGILAGFGIFSYFLIFVNAAVDILVPRGAAGLAVVSPVSMIFMAPSILFELTIGFWLIFKGINVQAQENAAVDSAVRRERKSE
jgi:hypothetical protein